MKKIIYILSLIAIGLIYSCSEKKQKYNNEPSNFFFKVPGTDIGITASKVPGAQFYVVFAKDSVLPSDTVDYIKYETGEMCNIQLIFDPQNNNTIYIRETEYLKELRFGNYDFQVLRKSDFFSRFFKCHHIKKDSLILKYPFIFVGMFPSTYGIYIIEHEPIFKWLKEGDIYGGW